MKKFITLLLVVLYTLSSVGAAVNTHYCMGKVMKCQCAKSIEDQEDPCCKDTVKFIKSQDVHAANWMPVQNNQAVLDEILPGYFEAKPIPVSILSKTFYLVNDSSWSSPPLYQLYCNYRI